MDVGCGGVFRLCQDGLHKLSMIINCVGGNDACGSISEFSGDALLTPVPV